MNRRNFLTRVLAVAAVGPLARFAPPLEWRVNTTPAVGTYRWIDRATYSFWRNQQVIDYEPLRTAMREIYLKCE